MGSLKSIVKIVVLAMVCAHAGAQNYLEFVENKGQWDSKIRFQGQMTTGAFLLQSNGYRVIRYNQSDFAAVTHAMHGGGGSAATPDVRTSLSTAGAGDNMNGGGGSGGSGSAPSSIRGHAYEMRFLNANPKPQIVPEKPQSSYSNYIIGNDSTKWASNCKTYYAVTYKNVYPNIDVRYYTSNGILKYDLIVNPGGDPSSIALYFDGVDDLRMKNGALHIKTSVDEVTELAPMTYQLIDNHRVEVPTSFDLKGNIVRFTMGGSYSKTSTLVIDPSIVFSTFTGSTADNWGYTATYDGKGNFYAGGIVFQNGKFPVSNGAFQTTFQGGGETGEQGPFDIAIIKFDPTGANRIYATYLGGSGNEQPHSLVVDGAGNLVIAGRTTSSNYPVAGALQKYGPGGGTWDIVITKLNATGTGLVGSVKIGGSGDDGVNIKHKYASPRTGATSINRNYGDDARSEVILDAAGNVYYASCTQSADFPVTAGSPQTTLGGKNAANRAQDAVILKLAPDLSSVVFSDLIGGSDDDAAFVSAVDPTTGNLYVAGGTASSDFPGNKLGVKYSSYQGGAADGFVVEVGPTGSVIRTAFFGTSGIDIIYGIQFDKFGDFYISGTTTGSWPVVNAPFSQAGGKQFISKVKSDLSDFIYSTVFGTNVSTPNISPTAFLVDRCQNVYVSGWGGAFDVEEGYPNSGVKGMTITPDAYQKTTDGNDFYFFVLEKNAASQLYGSYFGQTGGAVPEHVDGGTSRFDANGVIYQAICANCSGGASFPTTPGVWSESNAALPTGCNLAALKIAFNLAGIGSGILASINGVARDTSGCVPLTVDFSDTLAMGKQYEWDFGDNSSAITTVPKVSHTYNQVGSYRVRLVSVDSTSCNVTDTSYVTMRVRNDEANLGFNTTKLQPCAALSYQFDNTSSAIKPFSSNSFIWDFGDGTRQAAGGGSVTHTYTGAGTYTVKLILVDTSYCNAPDSVVKQIRLAASVKAQFTTPASGCAPYTAAFTNTSLGGTDFVWDFGDRTGSTATDPTHLYSLPGTYAVRLIASDTNTCNKIDTSAYFTITVVNKAASSFTYSPNPTEANTPVNFQNNASGATNYKWVFGDGDSLMTVRPDTTVNHLYNASGTYNTCLIAYSGSGCSDTSCQAIAVTVTAIANVASAFTPNGDGVNDKVYVRGYGIDQMTWVIYNRWGTVVYRGTDPNEGWDGTYLGRPQPQEVYHYTLTVSFSSKEKLVKKGDITLLR